SLQLAGAATLHVGGVATNVVNLHPGSALQFDNNNNVGNGATGTDFLAQNLGDRWADAAAINLNGALLDLIGNSNNPSSETVGAVTASRGARLRFARNGTGTTTLTLAS